MVSPLRFPIFLIRRICHRQGAKRMAWGIIIA